ncbi:MAG: hypothetical protein V3S98_03980, partial [Dehalococcoidia bacterium]
MTQQHEHLASHGGLPGGTHANEHAHVHPRRADLLSVEQALERVLALVHELPVAEVSLMEADGLTLARDIHAPFDIPALANSAMDGYALRAADAALAAEASPVTLPVVRQIQAGQLPGDALLPGTAVRIMTGAPVPDGADAIVPYEFTDEVERRKDG